MTPADLQRIRASRGWRERRIEVFADTADGAVLVKGQRPAGGAWRRRLLSGFARLIDAPMLAGDARAHGAGAQATEVARLRALAAAGVPVPEVLHVDAEFFVMRYIAGPQLSRLLDGAEALTWWTRGVEFLSRTHRAGQYLAQAYPRNFIVAQQPPPQQLVALDFESDSLRSMPLDAAMARDWLAYLFTTLKYLPQQQPQCVARLRQVFADEPPGVRLQIDQVARRLAWVTRWRGNDARRSWRRYVLDAQRAIGTIASAQQDHQVEKG